ncbi:MAG: protein-tyrosine-phosphatase [Acidobacteria bacterium]|nr:MAG: protein-tyrosine-phosphatase [Acidobacteriota bacterium]
MDKVLFLSTKDCARTKMAAALLHTKAPGKYEVKSAGTTPEKVSPMAKTVLKEIGIDLVGQSEVNVADVFREPFKFVITICKRTEEKCPVFPLATWLHWDISFPRNLQQYRQVRDELSRRIDLFLSGTLIHDGARQKLGSRPAKVKV